MGHARRNRKRPIPAGRPPGERRPRRNRPRHSHDYARRLPVISDSLSRTTAAKRDHQSEVGRNPRHRRRRLDLSARQRSGDAVGSRLRPRPHFRRLALRLDRLRPRRLFRPRAVMAGRIGPRSGPDRSLARRQEDAGHRPRRRGLPASCRAHSPSTPAQSRSERTIPARRSGKFAPRSDLLERPGESHLEGGVIASSDQGSLESRTLDVFLTASGPTPDSAAASPGRPNGSSRLGRPLGGRQLNRVLAQGDVVVRQGDRRAWPSRPNTPPRRKFVLSGGQPTLTDASSDTTTGRSLTFFVANDTILIDSQEGSRTLTKHRVEK